MTTRARFLIRGLAASAPFSGLRICQLTDCDPPHW